MSATTAAKKAEKKTVQKKSVHPPTAVMVKSALASLNDKNGSSLPVIKKYIAANYEGIDVARQAPFIRRYLRKAVAEGVVSQNKRTFWTGGKKDAKPKKPAAKKVKTPKKIVPKKKPAAAKKSPKKAAKLASAKKSPKIARKAAAKSPAKKPVAKKLTKRAGPKKATPKK